MLPRVAIIYLAYHSDDHLSDFVKSLSQMTYPRDLVDVVIVDNPHPEYGSGEEILRKTLEHIAQEGIIPRVHILPQHDNLGFSGGNNVGVARARELGVKYVIFHNDDGYFAPDGVEELVRVMEHHPDIGIAQALLILDQEKQLVNTSGNAFHYLGFGLCEHYRTPRTALQASGIRDIGYASGAAMIVSRETIEQYGAWDADFFMYHEDIDWSLRLLMRKKRVVVCYDALFFHKYDFSRSISKFYYMERNRFAILLMYFRMKTLLLLIPMLLLLEMGMILFSWRSGTLRTRLAIYHYWLKPSHWRPWLRKRRAIQTTRQLNDRALLERSVGKILFQEAMVEHWLLIHVGNPVMELYRCILCRLVWW